MLAKDLIAEVFGSKYIFKILQQKSGDLGFREHYE